MPHWQSLVALGIVAVTLLIFCVRLLGPKKASGCGKDCGCGKPQIGPKE
ncbi:hypothetical protein [Luteolibacter sp. LG18]|nr:hypothetical protein llg_44700 [Luteolibacter sp. LG18]